MKTRTVVERVGELLGPVDWSYDFRSHFNNHCCSDELRDAECAKSVEMLRQLASGGAWDVWIAHSSYFVPMLEVGMYDGWPYWKPVPSVATSTWLGGEWHSFSCVQAIRRREAE